MSEPLMTLSEFAENLSQKTTIKGAASISFFSVSIDTRTIKPNSLFFALKGNRDGHDFVQMAADLGAAAAVVERLVPVSIPQIVVEDVKAAFLESATKWRQRFKIPVVAVAGSNGKTTTTQMILSVIKARFNPESWVGTEGNFNNDLGVPLMLWKLRKTTEIAVFEVGMNHVGEMAPLVQAISPTVSVVTNTMRDHQEFLSSLEDTAKDNGQVYVALPSGGTAVINESDLFEKLWKDQAGEHRVITYGDKQSDVWGESVDDGLLLHTPVGHITVNLQLPGEHNQKNAVCATAVSYAMGRDLSDIKTGLENFQAIKHRGQVFELKNGSIVIDDSYNANPDSMIAAINLLSSHHLPTVFVMGDMGELGVKSVDYHKEIGKYAFKKQVDKLYCIGNRTLDTVEAFGEGAVHYDSRERLLGDLMQIAEESPCAILFKASNFMQLYKVAEDLVQKLKKE